MRTVAVSLGERSYSVKVGRGLLAQLGVELRSASMTGAIALVHDAALAATYEPQVRASLDGAGYKVTSVPVPSGEGSKSLEQLSRLYQAFAGNALDRGTTVVALGGGVTGDLAGFAAASYLRGVPFVQVPTTLLAQVDASVGGKTGIDLPEGKNLVGAFHQPSLVLADLDTLATLPPEEYRAGLAEVIKTGVIADAAFFDYLESNSARLLEHQSDVAEQIVVRCCEIKADVVGSDERESGRRAILNYGHTIGHAVEAVAGYGTYLHGEAVAIGMVAAGWLSSRLTGFPEGDAARNRKLLAEVGLPLRLREPLEPLALMEAMKRDKKARGGELRFVLARRIGEVEVVSVQERDVLAALEVIHPSHAAL